MESAVKENTLKLFCESKINRLINVLSAKDGLWARSTATRFCGGGIGRRRVTVFKIIASLSMYKTDYHVRCKSLPAVKTLESV